MKRFITHDLKIISDKQDKITGWRKEIENFFVKMFN